MCKWIIAFCVLVLSTTLHAEIKVLAFAGSTRKDSTNKKLIAEAARLAKQEGASVTLVDLKDYPIPFYDADLEAKDGMPPKAKHLRQLMIQSDVIMIASPEYNGSLSAVLKNAIDWISRDEEGKPSRTAFKDKKFVLMSASPGAGGGSRGLAHLRSIIENVGGVVIPQTVVIPDAYKAFDVDGHLQDPKLKSELLQLVQKATH